MKKLLALTVLVLMTLTTFSQNTTQDTTKSILPKSNTLKLTPLTLEIENVKYKAFTLPQTKVLINELVTLEYLNLLHEVKDREISEYQTIIKGMDKQILSLEQIDRNNQFIIGNQTTIIKNKDAVIHIKDKTIKRQRTKMTLGAIIGLGIIGVLVFR